MGGYGTVFQVIDLRSFSNIWYWIVLAAVWSQASGRVLGVPQDMMHRARRSPEALADLETLARIHGARLAGVVATGGALLVGLACALLTTLALLALVYRVELAQAVLLIVAPMTYVWFSTITLAQAVQGGLAGEALRARLVRQRRRTQAVGLVSIFVAALWGMYRSLTAGLLLG